MTAEIEPVLPHNLDAERAVLGAVLITPSAWAICASIVSGPDFFRQGHRWIFEAMQKLADKGVTIDTLTLRDALGKNLKEAGGAAYISGLTDGVPRSTNVPYYAGIVREKARLRAAIKIADALSKGSYEESGTATDLAQRAIASLTKAVEPGGVGPVLASEALQSYVGTLTDTERLPPLKTGYADVDEICGGFKPADLVIVAARPSVGKTSFALGAADYIAMSGYPTAFFSLEMGPEALAGRLLSLRSGVSTRAVETHTATELDYQAINETLVAPPPPLYLEYASKTVLEVAGWCRRLKQQHGVALACVVVDYLQLLRAERRRDNDESEIASISHDLKTLAKEEKLVVIALSQLSRAPDARKDKRPTQSDLRGSGALEQDADLCILLFREEMHSPKPENAGVAEVIIAKHRNGPTGVVKLAFHAPLSQFRNLAYGA